MITAAGEWLGGVGGLDGVVICRGPWGSVFLVSVESFESVVCLQGCLKGSFAYVFDAVLCGYIWVISRFDEVFP